MTKPRVYLAGPMTGIADYNFPMFNRIADALRVSGWDIVNPADNGYGEYSEALREAIKMMLGCDAIALLPGWERSKGAKTERTVAEALGMSIYRVSMLPVISIDLEPRESILQEAQRLVHGDRQHDYGPPTEDFARAAAIWSAYGWHVHEPRGQVRQMEPQDVAMGMAGVKLARLCHKYKRDSAIDLAGYAETLAICHGD